MSDDNNHISWDDDDSDDVEINSPHTVQSSPVFPPSAILGGHDESDGNPFIPSSDIVSVETASSENGESEHLTVVQIDADGNEVSTTIDLALPPLNEDEAREITDRIKSTTNILYVLIKRAHAGRAWKALGYTSFEGYVKEEFDYSRSYAYKLLNQANVIEAIEAVAPPGTSVYVGELTARGLKKSLPELLEEVEERTSDHEPEEATAIIEDIIRETKDRKEEDETFDEDFSDFNAGDYSSPSNAFDYIDDDDDSLDEFLGSDDDPSAVVNKLENLYTLLTGLQNFTDLAAKDNLNDLLPLIPVDRRDEVSRLVGINTEWMGKLKDQWETYIRENTVSDNVTDNDSDDNTEENDY